MLVWATLTVSVILSLIAPLYSLPAAQNDNVSNESNVKIFVKPTLEPSTNKKTVEVRNSPNFNQNVEGSSQGQEREGNGPNSNFAVIDEGLEIGSSRQNIDDPIALDDDFDSSNTFPIPTANFDGNQGALPVVQGDPSSFSGGNQGALPVFQGDPSFFSGGNQEVFPPFGPGPNNFPQQQFGAPPALTNQFPPQSPFVNQPSPFAFQQQQQQQPQSPFFTFQQPEAPEEGEDASEKTEGGEKKRISFLQSLFTF